MSRPMPDGSITATRLRRLIRSSDARAARAPTASAPATAKGASGASPSASAGSTASAAEERCELCGAPLPPEHRHLLDLEKRELRCACRACSILFEDSAAGGGRYRLVPDRVWRIEDLALDDARWASLHVPVGLAFMFHSTAAGRVVAFYPSPLGATESLLELEAWHALESANPVLGALEPDVEALLVNRSRDTREHWLAPVDVCYRLVGLVRTHWKGLSGGERVWTEIDHFFEALRRRSRRVTRAGEAR